MWLTTLHATRPDKSPPVNWCIVLFMTYWHKVQMIGNGLFVASSVDRLWGRSHASPKNAWKTPAAPLSPSFQSARACAFVASAVAKQQWPALSLTTRKFQLRIMDFQHWKSLAVALLLNLFQNGYLCTAVTSGVDAWCLCVSKENDQYKYNDQYRPTKHRTSCDVTIADAHIAKLMLKRYIVVSNSNPTFTVFSASAVLIYEHMNFISRAALKVTSPALQFHLRKKLLSSTKKLKQKVKLIDGNPSKYKSGLTWRNFDRNITLYTKMSVTLYNKVH